MSNNDGRRHNSFSEAARVKGEAVRVSKSQAGRRAALIETYGSAAHVVALIDDVLNCERASASLSRGTAATKEDRLRESRLWTNRRDEKMAALDAQKEPPDTRTAIEKRYPSVDRHVLIGAAQVYLSFLEDRSADDEERYSVAVLTPRYGARWFEDFCELLERDAPTWLRDYEKREDARETASIRAQVDAELEAFGRARYGCDDWMSLLEAELDRTGKSLEELVGWTV